MVYLLAAVVLGAAAVRYLRRWNQRKRRELLELLEELNSVTRSLPGDVWPSWPKGPVAHPSIEGRVDPATGLPSAYVFDPTRMYSPPLPPGFDPGYGYESATPEMKKVQAIMAWDVYFTTVVSAGHRVEREIEIAPGEPQDEALKPVELPVSPDGTPRPYVTRRVAEAYGITQEESEYGEKGDSPV